MREAPEKIKNCQSSYFSIAKYFGSVNIFNYKYIYDAATDTLTREDILKRDQDILKRDQWEAKREKKEEQAAEKKRQEVLPFGC